MITYILKIIITIMVIYIGYCLIRDFCFKNKPMKGIFGNITGGRKNVKKHSSNKSSFNNHSFDSSNTSKLRIPSKFPQVGVLTNEILFKNKLSDFVCLEKTDGIHANIIILDSSVYEIKHGKEEELFKLSSNFSKQTILDTEQYENMYYIFDCPEVDGEDISKKSYIQRMTIVNQWLDTNSSLKQYFVVKQFEYIDKKKLIECIKLINETNISPKTGARVDGIIFQKINSDYYDKDYICYKMKRAVLNTTDFKLIWDESLKCFYLYLIGNYRHVIMNRKLLPRINEKSIEHVNVNLKSNPLPNSFYILFSSPYFENLSLFEPSIHWDTSLYFENEKAQISQLMSSMIENPKLYDGKIVEMSLDTSSRMDNYWVPMRVREDKMNSNYYDVGLSNCSVVFNPITEQSVEDSNNYFTKAENLHFGKEITNPYHEINGVIRKYIIEHTINEQLTRKGLIGRNGLCVLDLAGGRGADELELYHCGARNIFAMDSDKTALVQYVERTTRTPNIDFNFLLKESIEPTNKLRKYIDINAVYGFLGKDNSDIEDDIRGRIEYPKDGFDVVIMNYAIHYLADNDESLCELMRMVSSLLKKDGLFIFSYFDGERIKDVINENKGKVGPFEIKWKDEMRNIAMMPLPTIDANGYRAEPLVVNHVFDVINECQEMKFEDEFEPLAEVGRMGLIDDIEDNEKVAEFLQFIHVRMMRKV